MNTIKRQIISLIISTSLFSPALVFAANNLIWKAGANEFVKLANQDKPGGGENNHPAQLEAEKISTVLSLLKTQAGSNGGSGGEELVFSDQQASALGQYIAQGLTVARADQDIIFAMEKTVNPALSLLKSDRYFVAGRVFYKDSKLNILIGDHNRPRDWGYETVVDPTHVGVVHYNFNYGHRTRPSKSFTSAIVELNGVENKQLNGTMRADWLVIDIGTSIEAYARETSNLKRKEMAKKRKEIQEILASGDEESVVEKDAVIQDDANVEGVDQAPSIIKDAATRSMEDRFTILKGLKDKGLITDEEYATKRKQLLNEL